MDVFAQKKFQEDIFNSEICYRYDYEDNRPTCRAVSVFRRKRKRFAVSKEQNVAVYGMYDPL